MQPLISVIIPVYKVEQYLEQCVESVRNQTYSNLEIWLVDDGSPDKCPEMCDEYAKLDKRIKVIHQVNGGQAAARNNALNQCTGDWIAFVDSDDWIEPGTYATLLQFAQAQSLDVVFCTAKIIVDTETVENRFVYFEDRSIYPSKYIEQLLLEDKIGGQPWMKIYKRNCWKQVRFAEGQTYEDLAISWLPFARLGGEGRVGFLTEPFYNYRMNQAGTSLGKNEIKGYDIFKAFLAHLEYAQNNMPQSVEVCTAKSLSAALEAYNASICSQNSLVIEGGIHAEQFIRVNRKKIGRNKFLGIKKKMLLNLFLHAPGIYRVIYIIHKKEC